MKIPKNGLIKGEDGQIRCWWHGNDTEYLRYHDEEWGWPVDSDQRLFEKINLEGFQAGLSWPIIFGCLNQTKKHDLKNVTIKHCLKLR